MKLRRLLLIITVGLCFVGNFTGLRLWAHLPPSGGVRGDFPRVGGVETVPRKGCGAHSSPKPQCPKKSPTIKDDYESILMVPADLVQSRKGPAWSLSSVR